MGGITDAPEWVRVHSAYYRRFNEDQYRTWSDILIREMGGTRAMLTDAVNEMIRSCFSGYLEDHFKYLRAWVSARAADGAACGLCGNMGLVSVPNRGRLNVDRIHVLCPCPRRTPMLRRYPSAATLEQYEERYGAGWRNTPVHAPQGSPVTLRDVHAARNSVGIAI